MVASSKINVGQDTQYTNTGNKFSPTTRNCLRYAVFQAEILGIKLACEPLLKEFDTYKQRYIKIFSDSQAAILALDNSEMASIQFFILLAGP